MATSRSASLKSLGLCSLSSLSDHRSLLRNVFQTARNRVIVVSPFISQSALNSDRVTDLVRSATGRGVSVSVYTDSGLNRTGDGSVKQSAARGVSSLIQAGARVYIANRIHNKTLIRDNNLIAEGSFNWLSAVRQRGAEHQREERTMVVEGKKAEGMVEEEVGKLEGNNPDELSIENKESDGVGFGPVAIGIIIAVVCFIAGRADIGAIVGGISFLGLLFAVAGTQQ